MLLVPACVPEGLAFVEDDRLDIVAPEDRSEVTLPVTIRWTIDDFTITGRDGRSSDDAGYFAVFVDQAPVPPGEPLSWVARDDISCRTVPGCPDRTYLTDRYIFFTQDTEFTFKHLPDLDAFQGHERHEVTIALLDGTGRRIGESAWFVTLFYDRKDAT